MKNTYSKKRTTFLEFFENKKSFLLRRMKNYFAQKPKQIGVKSTSRRLFRSVVIILRTNVLYASAKAKYAIYVLPAQNWLYSWAIQSCICTSVPRQRYSATIEREVAFLSWYYRATQAYQFNTNHISPYEPYKRNAAQMLARNKTERPRLTVRGDFVKIGNATRRHCGET